MTLIVRFLDISEGKVTKSLSQIKICMTVVFPFFLNLTLQGRNWEKSYLGG